MYKRNFLIFFVVLCSASVPGITKGQSQQSTVGLQCEHLVNPLGVDNPHPLLSWRMEDGRQGAKQTAYTLTVSRDKSFANSSAVVWQSGKVLSSSNRITYAGKRLEPFTRYYWHVKVWDRNGKSMKGIPVSFFETGMMSGNNWTGNWISDHGSINTLPAPYFRRGFTSHKAIRSATAYIAVAGLYELYINGKKIGNHKLDPMYTRFDRRTLYVTHDVTAQVQTGDNAIGVVLGNGWYNHQSLAVWNFERARWRQRPAFCMDLRITYSDGEVETISTNQSWKTSSGPIVFNSIYTGEHYDSRRQITGWSLPAYDDKKWQDVMLRASPSKNISSQVMVPIRNVDTIPPSTITRFNEKNYVFDIGRTIAGVTNVRLFGDSGTVVKIIHGERLYKPGNDKAGHVDLSNIDVYHRPQGEEDPFQTDIVTLNGRDTLFFSPKFNYKGFQYVEVVSSRPIALTKSSLSAYFMHSDVPAVGQISSSNELINKIWKATNSSYLSNLYGYPTDCPQREKNGWTGDGHFAVETGLYNYDAFTVYTKWMADHRDEQQPNGVLPDIIPTGGWGYGTANGTDWTSTIVIIPWNLYLFYGDKQPLVDNYHNMKAYVNYITRISPAGLTTFGRGDWVPVKSPSSLEYTSSVYYYADVSILAKTANLLGNAKDYAQYTGLATKIRKAINDKYFDVKKISYASGVQTELSMALRWGVVPEVYRERLAQNLAARVAADGMHLDVGVLGAKAILDALSDNGQAETAYRLAAQDTYPSWGWWIKNGATTLYENWDIDAPRDISQNHMMFGEIGAWFFKGLGGIHPDENAPGFKNIVLKPNFVSGLEYFNASHDGPYGKISSNWRRNGQQIIYQVVVPANSSATVFLPAQVSSVSLNGQKLLPNKQVHKVTAGQYTFVIQPSER